MFCCGFSQGDFNHVGQGYITEVITHTMDLLWEKFQWIPPLYMKPISFQSKASVVCSVTAAIFIDYCLKKLNVFSQHIGKKNKWISEFHRTNHQKLKCWSIFCLNYFLSYYLMMQHQPIVNRVPICTKTIAKSGYLFHAVGNVANSPNATTKARKNKGR